MNYDISKGPGLEHLALAAGKITSQLELWKVTEQIVSTLSEDMGADFSALWILEGCETTPDLYSLDTRRAIKGDMTLVARHGLDDSSGIPERFSPKDPVLGNIAADLSPYISDDLLSDEPVADRAWLRQHGLISYAGYPLIRGGRLLGAVAYFSRRPISPELSMMLLLLSHHCAIAIDNACQHQRVTTSEQRLRTLLDGAIDSVFILGGDGKILAASRSASRNLGYTMEELSRISFRDLDPDSFDILRESFPEMLSGEDVTYPGSFITQMGDAIPVEVRAGAAIFDGETVIQAYVRDISDRIRQQRQRADLVSMITHDLKGPLTVMLGYSEVILEQYADTLDDFVREGVTAIRTGGLRMRNMIDDYMSLSKLETGTITLKKYPLSIPEMLQKAVDAVRFNAELKQQELRFEVPDCMKTVLADGALMDRAINNLLINAVNYTPRGGSITVGCCLAPDGENAEITVEDTGVGIPAAELGMVFDKFYRTSTGGGKGSGLGLAIVKSVAEAHGGSVSVESEEGKGSRFRISLPVSAR